MMKVPPLPKEPDLKKFLDELLLEMDKTAKDNMSSITANKSLLLYAPNLSIFEVTVSNTGVITATKIQG